MNSKKEIISKYSGKTLGETTYSIDYKFYASELSKPDGLLGFLYEVNTHEAMLTEEGLNFLREYYGLNKVADFVIVEIRNGVDFKFSANDKSGIIAWIERLGDFE